jgi:hypothetical protein
LTYVHEDGDLTSLYCYYIVPHNAYGDSDSLTWLEPEDPWNEADNTGAGAACACLPSPPPEPVNVEVILGTIGSAATDGSGEEAIHLVWEAGTAATGASGCLESIADTY